MGDVMRLATLLLCVITAGLSPATAVELPLLSDFNSDTVGFPPATGGADQPSSVDQLPGGSILVQTSAYSLSEQPVVLMSGAGEAQSVIYSFDAIGDGTVRLEFLFSASVNHAGYFMQTMSETTIVGARLILTSNGQIIAQGSMVGTYTANSPCNLRIDVTPSSETYSVTVDNELNGFADDTTYSGIAYMTTGYPFISAVWASLNPYTTNPVSLAYDDIFIGVLLFEDGFESGDTTAWSVTVS